MKIITYIFISHTHTHTHTHTRQRNSLLMVGADSTFASWGNGLKTCVIYKLLPKTGTGTSKRCFSVRFTCEPMTDDMVIISSQLLVFQLVSKLLSMVIETKISLEMGIVINLNFQPHITHLTQQQAMVQEP